MAACANSSHCIAQTRIVQHGSHVAHLHSTCDCVHTTFNSAAVPAVAACRRGGGQRRPATAVAQRRVLTCVAPRAAKAAAGQRRGVLCAASLAAAAEGAATVSRLPRSPLAQVEQAAEAVRAALEAGQLRQQLVLLLPVNEKEANFMATEASDYPCSLQKEFDTACALTTSVLQRVLGSASASITSKRIDDGGVEGEPCAVLYPEDQRLLAVVFPTAERLKQIQAYAKKADRPLLIVNPQWNSSGQVVSDFGIGPWKKAAEDFLAGFEPTFVLKEKRIGSPGTINAGTGMRFASGGVVRVLRSYPRPEYETHVMAADGSSQQLATTAAEPSYQELDTLIKQGRQQKLEIFEVAQRVTYVYADAEEQAADAGISTAGGDGTAPEAEGTSAWLSDADIEALDAAALRRRLAQLGQPTSGRLQKLRERLKEAQGSPPS